MRELKENIHIQTVAKLLIAVAAIAHLIFTYVHTSALLLLENQICGFIMFLFVLLGLVTLFESHPSACEPFLCGIRYYRSVCGHCGHGGRLGIYLSNSYPYPKFAGTSHGIQGSMV